MLHKSQFTVLLLYEQTLKKIADTNFCPDLFHSIVPFKWEHLEQAVPCSYALISKLSWLIQFILSSKRIPAANIHGVF